MKKNLLPLLGIFLLMSSCEDTSRTNEDIPTSPNQTTIYFGGDILTMEGEEAQSAEAVVQQDGKIAFVGNLEDAEEQFPKASKKNLQGKTLLPGFID